MTWWQALILTGVLAGCSACKGPHPNAADAPETPTPKPSPTAVAPPSSDADAHQPSPPHAPSSAAANACSNAMGTTLTTDDGVELASDFWAGTRGGAGIVLLHMIPPHHTKANFPASFIQQLVEHGWSVINVNRRGAPGSQGVAKQAYKGDQGWLDAKAGRDFLTQHACAIDPKRIALIGASNGTTTAVDYAIHVATADAVAPVQALVYLSGGSYTEAQHGFADHGAVLRSIPSLFLFPKREAQWNRLAESASKGAPWTFVEYDPGAHGTNLFKSDPKSATTVIDFLDQHL